jgi:hypothetical protein
MHKLPNKSMVMRYRLVAILICLKWLLIVSLIGIFAYSFFVRDRELIIIGIQLAAVAGILSLVRALYAPTCKCPLCRVPLLSGQSCSKNTKAKSFLGSHRLSVARDILFLNQFRCPYCNEPTAMKSRR